MAVYNLLCLNQLGNGSESLKLLGLVYFYGYFFVDKHLILKILNC